MKIKIAHQQEKSTAGGTINFAVFEARSTSGNNAGLLQRLTNTAKSKGLAIDTSALAFHEDGSLKFYGDKKLVSYLSEHWSPTWTHTLDI